jgi:hypothetical protein
MASRRNHGQALIELFIFTIILAVIISFLTINTKETNKKSNSRFERAKK